MPFNTTHFRSSLQHESLRFRQKRHMAAKALGNYARDRVRSRIAPGDTEAADLPYPFPGYKATGHLMSHFKVLDAREGVSVSKVTMGLSRSAGRLARIKAFVHEYGKRIFPRYNPHTHLVFKIGTTWFRVKSVYIRPKKYFHYGWLAAHKGAYAILEQYMRSS